MAKGWHLSQLWSLKLFILAQTLCELIVLEG